MLLERIYRTGNCIKLRNTSQFHVMDSLIDCECTLTHQSLDPLKMLFCDHLLGNVGYKKHQTEWGHIHTIHALLNDMAQ